jgi:hypothetical protein
MKTYIQTLLVFFLFISCSKDIEPEVIPNYNLKVTVTPSEGGTVTPSDGNYPSGSVVKLTGVPVEGWEFESWSGDYEGTENPINITVDKEKTLTLKFSKKQELFVSKSPIYTYPNNTVGQIINSHYFPGMYINTEYANQHIDSIDWPTYEYRFAGRDGVYLDYNDDSKLDFFGFLTNFDINWSVNKGKFILIDNILNDSRTKKYYDTDMNHGGTFQLNDFNNDGKQDVMISSQNNHLNGDGGQSNNLPVKIIYFNNDGTKSEQLVGNPMGIHDSACGDVDNDGDVDLLVWLFSDPNITARPYLYLNDGNGNFNLTDNFQSFNGLQSILENEGPFPTTTVELFDINSDGFLDIIIASGLHENITNVDGAIKIYWGNGTGKFDLLNNYTDLPNTSITNFSIAQIILGFTFFDYDNDGDYDIVCSGTPNYGGYFIQLYEQTSKGIFKDVTTSIFDKWNDYISGPLDQYGHPTGVDGDFPNFYNLRIYDKNGDGLYDIVPDNLATWGGYQYVSNLYWENIGGSFIRKKENY